MPIMVPQPQPDHKTPTPRATNNRLTPCLACKGTGEIHEPFRWVRHCHTCDGTGFVPVKMTGAAGLTWGEQQEALLLLRYWYEWHRGGLEPDHAVVGFTKLLLDQHPAAT